MQGLGGGSRLGLGSAGLTGANPQVEKMPLLINRFFHVHENGSQLMSDQFRSCGGSLKPFRVE